MQSYTGKILAITIAPSDWNARLVLPDQLNLTYGLISLGAVPSTVFFYNRQTSRVVGDMQTSLRRAVT
jgi:hypothetical protein